MVSCSRLALILEGGRGWLVIQRFILIDLAVLVTLAAGLMTAIFIFRYPIPLEPEQAMIWLARPTRTPSPTQPARGSFTWTGDD